VTRKGFLAIATLTASGVFFCSHPDRLEMQYVHSAADKELDNIERRHHETMAEARKVAARMGAVRNYRVKVVSNLDAIVLEASDGREFFAWPFGPLRNASPGDEISVRAWEAPSVLRVGDAKLRLLDVF